MSQPKAAPAPPVASSSGMMLDSPIKENPNERTILGTMERISLDTLPASQAVSISYAGDKIITQQLLDVTAHRDHDEFMDDLREDAGYNPKLGDRRLQEEQGRPPKRKQYHDRQTEANQSMGAHMPELQQRINMGEPPLLRAGSQFMRADLARTVTGHLPRPLGRARPVRGDWYDVCNMQSSSFLDLLKEARRTAHSELTPPMQAALRWVQLQT